MQSRGYMFPSRSAKRARTWPTTQVRTLHIGKEVVTTQGEEGEEEEREEEEDDEEEGDEEEEALNPSWWMQRTATAPADQLHIIARALVMSTH